MKYVRYNHPYNILPQWEEQGLPKFIELEDHLNGHESDMTNLVLKNLNNLAKKQDQLIEIKYHQILEKAVTSHYPNLQISFSPEQQDQLVLGRFYEYNIHPEINFKNFVCSFNGIDHVSRKLLVSILKKFNYFDPTYCSKNFSFSLDVLDGHVSDYVNDRSSFYNKFFLNDEEFCKSVYSFGHDRFNHAKNIYKLESKLTQSFLHIVSETIATSYVPFVTEKFLYSVVTRGLFLTYAQPGWHDHLEKYYGFKKYTKLFDYKFDTVQNPIERLVELITMISKFSVLKQDEWNDLYLMEQDTIEYNYNHYYSRDYLKSLEKFT